MIKRVKKLWTKALRSGEYIQGQGQLVTPPEETARPGFDGEYEFCCLGVLANLYHEEKGTEFNGIDFPLGGVPESVQRWAGLDNGIPDVEFKGCTKNIADLNDEELVNVPGGGKRSMTFKELANIIERQL